MLFRSRRRERIALGLAVANLLTWPLGAGAHTLAHYPGFVENVFPFHLCDLASILAAIALLTRHRLALLLTYLFGLAGTLQGLATPSLTIDFPNPVYFTFFYHHGIVVITALLLPLGFGWRPELPLLRSLFTAFATINLYALCVFVINFASGTNYAFLRKKPPGGSLLDQLGPWPYYIGVLEIVCLLLFAGLLLPFHILKMRTAEGAT